MVLKFEFESGFEQRFREAAMKRYGFAKGSLKKATQEALGSWVSQHSGRIPKEENPFALVEGILVRLKGRKSSVQLQHEAGELWSARYS